jgi:hypothetical protein
LNAGIRLIGLFGSWGHQSSLILRTPLKRATPSFTVEYRQAKRPNTGSAKLGWAHAKPAPPGSDEKVNRIAMSAFKTVAAHPPSDVISPSIVPGRILPSLIQTAPVTEQADASVEKAGAPRSEKRSRRPAEKQEKLDNSPGPSAKQCEPAPVGSISGLPTGGKPSSTTRASRILGRYVFRDELSPGESWKRRIEARRERRA